MKNKISIVIEKTNTGFSAYSKKYAVATTGETISEIKKNIVSALNLYFEAIEKDVKVSQKMLSLTFDLSQLLAYYPFFDIEKLADYLNIDYTTFKMYQQGKIPTEENTKKIFSLLKKIGQELQEFKI